MGSKRYFIITSAPGYEREYPYMASTGAIVKEVKVPENGIPRRCNVCARVAILCLLLFNLLVTWLLVDQFRPCGGVHIAKELLQQPQGRPHR